MVLKTKLNDYKVLFCLRLLKSIIDNFVDVFLVLYFLEVSENNIIPLGTYQILVVFGIYVTIFLCRNIVNTKHRISLMRIAMILELIYFCCIAWLKADIVNYAYLIGILRGVEEGFYYSIYNILESEGVKNRERSRFIGGYKAAKSVLLVVFPVVFGSIMYASGFIESVAVVAIIVAMRIVLSFIYQDHAKITHQKTNLRQFRQLMRQDSRFRAINAMNFFSGLTYSASAFSYVTTIYIIKVFSNSFSLGIFTAIFNIVAGVIGFYFARFLRRKNYNVNIVLTNTVAIIAFLIMIFNCNAITIVIFKFFQVVSSELTNSINEYNKINLCNDIPRIRDKFKSEYWLNSEKYLFYGRFLSYALFISMAFTDAWNITMFIFAICIVGFMLSSVALQYVTREDT